MTDKVQLVKIELAQATGLEFECARRATVYDWRDADITLRRWDSDRPEKVDYELHFEDGEIMQGTIEIGPISEDEHTHISLQSVATYGIKTLMALDANGEGFRKFIDRTGEKRLSAIVIGAKYDFGCDTNEPAISDKSVLVDYINHETEGKDAELSLSDDDVSHAIIFADGQTLMVEDPEAAKYLQRQWRIMNNIHPIIGGQTRLVEDGRSHGPTKTN